MRLIDAGALKEIIKERRTNIEKNHGVEVGFAIGMLLACEAIIDEQPTIEAKPVVHAHWDKDRCCTHCGRTYMDIAIAVWEDFSENEADIPSCCPYCGAQMDEKGVKIPVLRMEDVPKIMEEMID